MKTRFPWLFQIVLCVLLAFTPDGRADSPTTMPAGKTVRLLAIGNSFSNNATKYLPAMVEAGGNKLELGRASISGASLERHLKAIQAMDTDPSSAGARPYVVTINGVKEQWTLQQMLAWKQWDFVTIQQASPLSYKPETYQPFADELVSFVREHAPQAKIVVHETWAYRIDHPLFKSGTLTQERMYAGLHRNYQQLAGDVEAVAILPVGTAFQNVREDPRWKTVLQMNVNPKDYVYPQRPPVEHALCAGWLYATRREPPVLYPDRFHASPLGEFLGAAVWHEYFFGDVRGNPYRPDIVSEADASLLREMAHRTVQEGLTPRAAGAPLPDPTTRPATQPARTPAMQQAGR